MAGLVEYQFKSNDYGQREDLLDKMVLVDEKTTPFLSMVKKGATPRNTYVEWHVDKYDSPEIENATVDGTDVEADIQGHGSTVGVDAESHAGNRDKLSTYVQVQRRIGHVSRLAQDVNVTAGVPNEFARAVAHKTVELGRDMESTLLGYREHQAGGASTPYLTRGMGTWLIDDATYTANGLEATKSAGAPASGAAHYITQDSGTRVPAGFMPNDEATIKLASDTSASDVTETVVQDMLQAIFDNTGMIGDYKLIAGSVLRRQFTTMTRAVQAGSSNPYYTNRQFNTNLETTRIKDTTQIYEGDFGILEILPSNFIGQQFKYGGTEGTNKSVNKVAGYILDMDKIELKFYKRPGVEEFEDRGGGRRFMIETGYALCVGNPIGMGSFNSRYLKA
jgi:hypothetical protein